MEFDFRRGTVLLIFLIFLDGLGYISTRRKCLLRYHIPAIPIPTQRRVVQKLFVRFFLNFRTLFQTI